MTPFFHRVVLVAVLSFIVRCAAAAGTLTPLQQRWLSAADIVQQLQNSGDAGAEAAWRTAIDSISSELPDDIRPLPLRLSQFAFDLHLQGFDVQAYPLAARAAEIAEKSGDKHEVAVAQARLGAILMAEHEYARAEPVLRRSLAILDRTQGPEALDTAVAENNLAVLYSDTNRPREAEKYQRLALPVYEKYAAAVTYADALCNLFVILGAQHRHEEGVPYLLHALDVAEKNFPDSAAMARVQACMAMLEFDRGHAAKSAEILEKVIALQERTLGPNHPALASSLTVYARVERALHRKAESKQAEARAQAIFHGSAFR